MGKTVMIIDDSRTLRHVVETSLNKAGYMSMGAVDGVDALRKLEQGLPDLIICDIFMPNMDGITFLKELKKIPGHSDIPVLMLTTESQAGRREEARMAGAAGWITKPFTSDQLIKAVDRVIS